MDAITTEDLKSLESMPLSAAINQACIMVDNFKTKNVQKKAVLKSNVKACDKIDRLLKIMWYALLSGEGLSVFGSGYQHKFGDSKIVLGSAKSAGAKKAQARRAKRRGS
jgi:hypothetical protein